MSGVTFIHDGEASRQREQTRAEMVPLEPKFWLNLCVREKRRERERENTEVSKPPEQVFKPGQEALPAE